MQFQVQITLGGVPIPSSEVPNLKINSPTVQRIVNRVAQRCMEAQSDMLPQDAVAAPEESGTDAWEMAVQS